MIEEGPLVSVILVSYNQGKWLREAIESVVSQTYPRWELMLVDNGSTDDTLTVLDAYKAEPRIKVIRYENNQKHTVVSTPVGSSSRFVPQ